MRFGVTIAAIVLIASGCHRPQESRTVRIQLNPHARKFTSESPTSSKDRAWPYATCSPSSRGGQGEWPVALGYSTSGKEGNPQVIIRCFDAADGAVSVEVTFTGPPLPDLETLTFVHVTKATQFAVKSEGGSDSRPYDSERWFLNGENLELRWPATGGVSKVTFLAWPYVR